MERKFSFIPGGVEENFIICEENKKKTKKALLCRLGSKVLCWKYMVVILELSSKLQSVWYHQVFFGLWEMSKGGAAFDYGYRMISKRNENLWEASTSVFSMSKK